MKKKTVHIISHSHWDREWYREFEIFRMRLLRVFDNVLEMLAKNKIPCFYFAISQLSPTFVTLKV